MFMQVYVCMLSYSVCMCVYKWGEGKKHLITTTIKKKNHGNWKAFDSTSLLYKKKKKKRPKNIPRSNLYI